jgi:beta-glucosidase
MKPMKYAILLLAGIAVATGASQARDTQPAESRAQTTERPWMNAALAPEKRADLILSAMTLDEKIALLHGSIAMAWGGAKLPPGAIGSAGFVAGNDRLGIPALQESDASLGVTNPMLVRGADDMSTALPSSLALAATFNPAIADDGGRMVGSEARAKGINVQLAGGANLLRDPRGGRNFEYVGEDPLLAGVMAGESIRGIQSAGVISTAKHFALNDQEHNRMTVDSVIGEAAARESDLLAFEIALERGKPGAVMCAYNRVNGAYGCENAWLLDQVLKRDWKYPGFVMSDWGAVHGLQAFGAGLDQQSGEQLDDKVWFDQPLKGALETGAASRERVDDAARRILRAMFAAGLFDRAPAKQEIDFAAHAQVAQREAEESIVLMKNERGILPLAAGAKRIAVIGGHADAGVPSGTGSSQVTNPYRQPGTPLRTVPLGGEGLMGAWANVVFHPSSPLAALRARFKGAQVTYDNGAYPATAAAAARDADVAIVFAYQPSGEGDDVPNMNLPFGQNELIEAVAAANPNTVVVLETGNPVALPWAGKVAAIVEAWYAGQRGGEAIARVLTGEVNPSGRLPVTWPHDEGQLPRPVIPGTGAGPNDPVKVDYTIEGSDVGYRWFAREGKQPRYWFGYGLSYTRFAYRNMTVKGGRTVSVSFDVTNTGDRAGKVVPQLFLTAAPAGPKRRLLAFDKISLAPGETGHVTLAADPRLLAEFDEAGHNWRVAPGRYGIAVGTDANDMVLRGEATLSAASIKP